MLSNTQRLNFYYLKIIQILHPRHHPKIMRHILKNKQNNNCVCFHKIIRLTITKMEMKIKNKSYRYDINRLRSRHGHTYSKYKKCLSMMMARSLVVSDLRSETEGFPVRVRLLAMCRGELSAVTARLVSKCL